MAKKPLTLEEELLALKSVDFKRELIETLNESLIRKLVQDYVEHPQQSVGQKFVKAMETLYHKRVVAEADDVINVDATIAEIIAVINGTSTSQDGKTISVGRRGDRRTYYLRWIEQMKAEEVKIRDPFNRNGLLERYVENDTVVYLGADPYDAQIADADGKLVIEQDLYVLLRLSWQTGEAQPVALANVNERLLQSEKEGKEVTAANVATFFPQAHQRLIRIKGEKRGRDWQRYVDSLMDSEAPSSSMPPFGDPATGGNQTPIDWPSRLEHTQLISLIEAMAAFSKEELIEVARESGVDHENLPYSNLSGLRRELVQYHQRRTSVARLMTALTKHRPQTGWAQVIGLMPQKAGHGDSVFIMSGDFRDANLNIGNNK